MPRPGGMPCVSTHWPSGWIRPELSACGNEGGRCQVAAVGTAKPEQRLDLDQALMRQLENGLIHQIERLVLKGRAQFALQPAADAAIRGRSRCGRARSGRARPPWPDRARRRRCGSVVPAVRPSFGIDRHTQAAARRLSPAVEMERRLKRRRDPRRHRRDSVELLQSLLHQRELVAAEPSPGVAGAGDRSDRRAATSRSSASPAKWPSASLISLNWSRSSNITATCSRRGVRPARWRGSGDRGTGCGWAAPSAGHAGQVSYRFFGRISLGDVDGGADGADDACRKRRVPARR